MRARSHDFKFHMLTLSLHLGCILEPFFMHSYCPATFVRRFCPASSGDVSISCTITTRASLPGSFCKETCSGIFPSRWGAAAQCIWDADGRCHAPKWLIRYFLYNHPFKTWYLLKDTNVDQAIFFLFFTWQQLSRTSWHIISEIFIPWCHSKFLFTCIAEMRECSLGLILEAHWMSNEIPFWPKLKQSLASCKS